MSSTRLGRHHETCRGPRPTRPKVATSAHRRWKGSFRNGPACAPEDAFACSESRYRLLHVAGRLAFHAAPPPCACRHLGAGPANWPPRSRASKRSPRQPDPAGQHSRRSAHPRRARAPRSLPQNAAQTIHDSAESSRTTPRARPRPRHATTTDATPPATHISRDSRTIRANGSQLHDDCLTRGRQGGCGPAGHRGRLLMLAPAGPVTRRRLTMGSTCTTITHTPSICQNLP